MLPAILAGCIAMLFLSWLPLFGPLLAGFIAGLAAQHGAWRGASAGAISGALAGLLLGGLLLFLTNLATQVVVPQLPPDCWLVPVHIAVHIAGGVVLLLHAAYFALLGGLGGLLGGSLVHPRRASA